MKPKQQAATKSTAGHAQGQASPAIYSALVRADISHGAFRFWHLLLDYRNRDTGTAWPSQRLISQDMHCKVHSIRGWVQELRRAGLLEVSSRGQRHYHEYRLILAMPIWATRKPSRDAHLGTLAMPKGATPRVSHMGIESDPKEVIPGSEGASPRETWKVDKELERVEKSLARELESVKPDRKVIRTYQQRRTELRAELASHAPPEPEHARPKTKRPAAEPAKGTRFVDLAPAQLKRYTDGMRREVEGTP